MPLYEYQCTECGHLTEVLQRLSDPPLAKCPECGEAVRKLLSAPAFQFKGSGWYVTDYARKGQGGGDGDGKPGAKSDAGDKQSAGDGAKKEKAEKKAKPAAGSPSD